MWKLRCVIFSPSAAHALVCQLSPNTCESAIDLCNQAERQVCKSTLCCDCTNIYYITIARNRAPKMRLMFSTSAYWSIPNILVPEPVRVCTTKMPHARKYIATRGLSNQSCCTAPIDPKQDKLVLLYHGAAYIIPIPTNTVNFSVKTSRPHMSVKQSLTSDLQTSCCKMAQLSSNRPNAEPCSQ